MLLEDLESAVMCPFDSLITTVCLLDTSRSISSFVSRHQNVAKSEDDPSRLQDDSSISSGGDLHNGLRCIHMYITCLRYR